MPEADYVDEVIEELAVMGGDDEISDDEIGELVEVGAIEEVGARTLRGMRGSQRARALRRMMLKRAQGRGRVGAGLPSPPFGRSARDTERRAPLGFTEDTSGANFFTLPAVIGGITTMRAKVSRAAHADRLLIVPSAPGAVFESIKVGWATRSSYSARAPRWSCTAPRP